MLLSFSKHLVAHHINFEKTIILVLPFVSEETKSSHIDIDCKLEHEIKVLNLSCDSRVLVSKHLVANHINFDFETEA